MLAQFKFAKIVFLFFSSVLLVSITTIAAAASSQEAMPAGYLGNPSVEGVAYDLNGFETLYTEQYYSGNYYARQQRDGGNDLAQDDVKITRVLYKELNAQQVDAESKGSIFAVKDIDYSESPLAPFYRIVDIRLQQIQAATHDSQAAKEQDNLTLSLFELSEAAVNNFDVSAFVAKPPSNIESAAEIVKQFPSASVAKSGQVGSQNLVTDAGFDNYIRQNWKSLVADKGKLDFSFAVPSRGQSVAMTIRAISSSDCEKRVKVDVPKRILGDLKDERCFKLEAKNWIIAKVLKPIYLVYDSEQRLQIFRGLSNIRGLKNRKLRVLIRYRYPV